MEAIGFVRHKNLVKLLGYHIERAYRYENFSTLTSLDVQKAANDLIFLILDCL